jgi:hypothetical protein
MRSAGKRKVAIIQIYYHEHLCKVAVDVRRRVTVRVGRETYAVERSCAHGLMLNRLGEAAQLNVGGDAGSYFEPID